MLLGKAMRPVRNGEARCPPDQMLRPETYLVCKFVLGLGIPPKQMLTPES